MRKIISYLLLFVICLALPLSASAATAPESEKNANVDLLRQQIEEVNNYLADNAEPVDLIDQTVEYAIPLDYKTTGYVGFDVAGVAANLYFTQEIAFVDNCDQNTKIQCGISYTI